MKEVKNIYVLSIDELERSSKGGYFNSVTHYQLCVDYTPRRIEIELDKLNKHKRKRFWKVCFSYDFKRKSEKYEYLRCIGYILNCFKNDKIVQDEIKQIAIKIIEGL